MCCQENDKSSPSSHLSLPLAARIFSSTHSYPLSGSAFSLSVPCPFSLVCADSSSLFSCVFPIFHSSSLALVCADLPSFFALSCLLSPLILCLPSPIPHLQTSTLLCLLIFLPSPQYAPNTSHIMHTHSVSQLLLFSTLYAIFLSRLLFYHFFSLVCCDHSQAGDSCSSRQSDSGH